MLRFRSVPHLAASISLVALLALAGCGGSDASSKDDGGGPSAAASVAASSADKGGNGGAGSAAGAADALVAPNATETSRTTSGGLILITYESTDSVDSLTSHYESAIADAGMTLVGKTTAGGGANLIFQLGNVSGSVTLIPSSVNDGGTSVAISVLDESV